MNLEWPWSKTFPSRHFLRLVSLWWMVKFKKCAWCKTKLAKKAIVIYHKDLNEYIVQPSCNCCHPKKNS